MKLKILSLIILFPLLISNINVIELKHDIDSCQCNKNISENEFLSDYKIIHGLGELPIHTSNEEGVILKGNAPSHFDWRDVIYNQSTGTFKPGIGNGSDWTTPIKNQGACNSCYAFAVVASLESVYKIKFLKEAESDIDFSEQFIVSCGTSCDQRNLKGCIGGRSEYALDFIRKKGMIYEDKFPYNSQNGDEPDCKNDKEPGWNNYRVFINEDKKVSYNTDTIKNALIEYGPLVSKMTVYEDFYFSWYNESIPHYPNLQEWPENVYYHKYGEIVGGDSADIQNHAIIIVGYEDNPSIENGGYWICKNSWGKSWGLTKEGQIHNYNNGGWFKIAYQDSYINYDTFYINGLRVVSDPISELTISDQKISLGKIEPDSNIKFTFNVSNTGDDDSKLYWGIYESPNCGNGWSYKDDEGNEFEFINGIRTPNRPINDDGEFTVHVSFNSPVKGVSCEDKIIIRDINKTKCIEKDRKSINISFQTKQGKSKDYKYNYIEKIQKLYHLIQIFLRKFLNFLNY